MPVEMDDGEGQPSRWNTLRALRVLDWYSARDSRSVERRPQKKFVPPGEPMPRFDILAFDADDTLWHTERLYVGAQHRFRQLLSHYHDREWVEARLYETEMRNLGHFGYGIKAFALSMIETALELTEGRISGADIQAIITMAKDMLSADVELLDHVAATLPALADRYPLMIITKGDLRDQEQKIARSGVAAHFQRVEIVSDKSRDSYAALLGRHGLAAERFMMIGNSLRSDILPVLALGATAVYIPYPLTWAHEAAELPARDQPGFHEIVHIGLLPELLARLENGA
jgi:putative hydrolase of the HAD superfamily